MDLLMMSDSQWSFMILVSMVDQGDGPTSPTSFIGSAMEYATKCYEQYYTFKSGYFGYAIKAFKFEQVQHNAAAIFTYDSPHRECF